MLISFYFIVLQTILICSGCIFAMAIALPVFGVAGRLRVLCCRIPLARKRIHYGVCPQLICGGRCVTSLFSISSSSGHASVLIM